MKINYEVYQGWMMTSLTDLVDLKKNLCTKHLTLHAHTAIHDLF